MWRPKQGAEGLEGPASGDPDRSARSSPSAASRAGSRHRRSGRRLAGAHPLLLRIEGPPAVGRPDPGPVPSRPRVARRIADARSQLDRFIQLSCRACCRSSASRNGPCGSRSGCGPTRRRRWPRTEVLDKRWRADRRHRSPRTGDQEVPRADGDDLALRLGALIDGLAIQVLMNDSDVTPARMRRSAWRSRPGARL